MKHKQTSRNSAKTFTSTTEYSILTSKGKPNGGTDCLTGQKFKELLQKNSNFSIVKQLFRLLDVVNYSRKMFILETF